MQKKVSGIAADLAERIMAWPGVVAVVLGETASVQTIDPYFSIELAVCYEDGLPAAADRGAALGAPLGFAQSTAQSADHFLVDDLPVRVLYRARERLDGLLERVEHGDWVFRDETTSVLYRFQNGNALIDRGDWLGRLRERLGRIPDAFWTTLKESSRSAVDTALADLGAAVYRGDHLYYQLSASSFLQGLCSFLFALNRQLEPSHRMLLERITKLETLPAEFSGRFDGLIRPDIEITPARRYEICQLIARSITHL
jgi:hypothetical protein